MIKVTALTAYRSDPCSRFRFRQFIAPLAPHGIAVEEHYLPITRYRRHPLAALGMLLRIPGVLASRSGDVTWFRRELIPERATFERFTGGKRIFDVDDAIWLNSPSPFSERIVEMSDGVIAGNAFLADHYRSLGKPVWIVPTVVDTEDWRPGKKPNDGLWRLGWLGTRYNLRYFDAIEEPLADFLNENKNARLRIVCDGEPNFRRISKQSVEYVPWSATGEIAATQAMDVGMMPLEDDEWSRGKCAAKMICYLSVAVPAIVSPVGVNQDVLAAGEVGFGPRTTEDWFDAFQRLYQDRDLSLKMGQNGRRVVETGYSVTANVGKLVEIFRTVTGRE